MVSSTLALTLFSVLCFRATLGSGLGKGKRCAHAPGSCKPPLSCLGTGAERKCFKKKGLRMICGLDPYWVCEDDLICDGFCKNPVGSAGSCNSILDACIPPLSCVGRSGNKKCFMKKALGERCGKDPFWVCQDGLTCEDGKCKETPVGVAGSCNLPGEVCIPPLACIGNDGNKKCFEKKRVGMKCGDGPFSVCQRSLYCDGTCRATVGKGRPCNSFNKICHPTLKCVGPPGNKVCEIRGKGLGMMCNDDPLDPYWWCEEDLVCDDGICKKPVEAAGACNNPDTVCIKPLSCVGREGNKKCFKKREKGMKCPDPFWVCADNLVCDVDKICKKPVGVAGRCNVDFQICKSTLVCERTRKGEKCVMRAVEGKPCGKDPFWRCADGLKCEGGICEAA